MSRMPLRRFASAAQKAVKDPRLTYDFRPATGKDLGVIVDLCCTDFIKIEPHSRALGLTGEESKHLFEWIVAKALHYPYSLKVVEKSSGRVAAIRTLSIGNRDHNLDWEPFPLDETKLSRNIGKLASVLDGSKKHFWEIVDPTISKVMRREVSFVRAEHQRRGIARVMVDLNLIPEELRSQGIHGIVSEASSIANQTLLASSGYKCIYEPKYDWAKKIDDGTTGVKVFFKDLRL